jgi:hypothetical protein
VKKWEGKHDHVKMGKLGDLVQSWIVDTSVITQQRNKLMVLVNQQKVILCSYEYRRSELGMRKEEGRNLDCQTKQFLSRIWQLGSQFWFGGFVKGFLKRIEKVGNAIRLVGKSDRAQEKGVDDHIVIQCNDCISPEI